MYIITSKSIDIFPRYGSFSILSCHASYSTYCVFALIPRYHKLKSFQIKK